MPVRQCATRGTACAIGVPESAVSVFHGVYTMVKRERSMFGTVAVCLLVCESALLSRTDTDLDPYALCSSLTSVPNLCATDC